jgi:hypothetical protein
MATRKKLEGIASAVAKPSVSIQELTMQDFFAAFALQGLLSYYGDRSYIPDEEGHATNLHAAAFEHADEMIQRRVV